MIGAIIGDVVGSRFEWRNHQSKEFDLFDPACRPTDDSVMSLAVARAILESASDHKDLCEKTVRSMQGLGRAYPEAGYGGMFSAWIASDGPRPYQSFGNGAGMRVGPAGFAAESLEEARLLSRHVTVVTHDHPLAVAGAEAIATSICLARSGATKAELRRHIEGGYYTLDFTIDELRPTYRFDVTCQGSIPVALEAFLESRDFEDAIRTAVSVGGDTDTIAAMAGSVAEAYYGVPEHIVEGVLPYLDNGLTAILFAFERAHPSRVIGSGGTTHRWVSDVIEARRIR